VAGACAATRYVHRRPTSTTLAVSSSGSKRVLRLSDRIDRGRLRPVLRARSRASGPGEMVRRACVVLEHALRSSQRPGRLGPPRGIARCERTGRRQTATTPASGSPNEVTRRNPRVRRPRHCRKQHGEVRLNTPVRKRVFEIPAKLGWGKRNRGPVPFHPCTSPSEGKDNAYETHQPLCGWRSAAFVVLVGHRGVG